MGRGDRTDAAMGCEREGGGDRERRRSSRRGGGRRLVGAKREKEITVMGEIGFPHTIYGSSSTLDQKEEDAQSSVVEEKRQHAFGEEYWDQRIRVGLLPPQLFGGSLLTLCTIGLRRLCASPLFSVLGCLPWTPTTGLILC